MKTLTVRLPEQIVAAIETESRRRGISRSDVVRERLQAPAPGAQHLDAITDVIGALDELPSDLSARRKRYLRATGYGRRPRAR